MTPASYIGAVLATVLFVAGVARLSVEIRRHFAPDWMQAPARLLEAVLGVGLVTSASLVLGTFGLLSRASLIIMALIALAAAVLMRRRRLRPGSKESTPGGGPRSSQWPMQGTWQAPAALAVAVVIFAQWGIAVSWSVDAGIQNFDSVWYHLPFAAEFAQSGETLPLRRLETVFLSWFYPQSSELLHSVGMLLAGYDILSLALNLGWLGLALLAAWCAGRPTGRGALTVAAAAVVLTTHSLVAREPGTGKNDIVVLALLVSAVAILLCASRRERTEWFPFAVAALATGLAAGVKVTALAPAFGLTVAALYAARSGFRLRSGAIWAAGLSVGGGYWYLRNLVAAGNPLPQVESLGPLSLPGPEVLQEGRPDFNVWHYLGDGEVWEAYFLPGLTDALGALWPGVIALGVAGGLVALVAGVRGIARTESRDSRLLAGLGFAVLVGMVAYLFTPLSAAGVEGEPVAFAINVRFVLPVLAIGVILIAAALPISRRPGLPMAFVILIAVAAVGGGVHEVILDSGRLFGWAVAIGLIAVPAIAARLVRGPLRVLLRPAYLTVVVVGYLIGAAAFGYQVQDSYFDSRYRDFKPELGLAEPYRWASGMSDVRIALAGTTAGLQRYGFYGKDLSNQTPYVARRVAAGGFHPYRSCQAFRRGVNALDADYLVTSPVLNFQDVGLPIPSPEAEWADGTAALSRTVQGHGRGGGVVTVWRVVGDLDPRGCGE